MRLWVTPENLKAGLEGQCLKESLVPQDIVDSTLIFGVNAHALPPSHSLDSHSVENIDIRVVHRTRG